MKMKVLHVFLMVLFGYTMYGQVTTSSMSGKVTDDKGEALIGATVVALHVPSGTSYGTVTNENGLYSINNMRVGGPYEITASYVGYADQKFENLYLKLGENYLLNTTLGESSVTIETIQIVGKPGTLGRNVGAGSQITSANIDVVPTLNRGLNDFLRLSPQSTGYGSGVSFVGTNNRYNAVFIDGAVNNDVFGLSDTGTNGGQTGISPVSIDIIDQFQVVLSPYDVSLGGFAGGGVNAVTKSGTNNFEGTAYYFLQNESMVGKTNKTLTDRTGSERKSLNPFSNNTYGLSLGGPIIKDKLFFFTNVEIQSDNTPLPYDFGTYKGSSNGATLDSLVQYTKDKYGYDPGSYLTQNDELKGLKLFGKIDYNINKNNSLTIRHSYTKAEQFDRFAGSANRINFSNNGIYFPSITNSTAVELKTRFNNASNNLIIGYTKVRDNRDPLGLPFPYVTIEDGSGSNTITFGTEEFSTANKLDQDIFTLTDNFKLYRGNHTITLGTHNEYYDMFNSFIPQNFGSYRFKSINDFKNGTAFEYRRSYSLVDDVTGDNSKAAAALRAMQIGVYAQDEIRLNSKLNITAGLRIDMPVILDDPEKDKYLNDTALPKIATYYSIAKGVEAGKSPDGQIMFSPRLGFNYQAKQSINIRGGLGIFTSRIPFVWPAAMFNNNGLTQGTIQNINTPTIFEPNINDQYVDPNFKVPSGSINLFTPDFKYPQVFRANLGFDFDLPGGLDASIEGIYTKTLNNIVYTNINSDTTVSFYMAGADNRPVFTRKSIDPTYSEIYLASNTSEGHSYTITGQVAKNFDFGLNATLAYTYGDASALSEGTSSQNSSQWRGQVNVNGRNFPSFGRSDFATGQRLLSTLTYKLNWNNSKTVATTFSLIYEGQKSNPFSYVIGGSGGRNLANETGSTSRNRSLIYIPKDRADINLVDYKVGTTTITADEQWQKLNSYIESDPYLSENRGGYAEKNSNWMPYVSFLDFAVRQDLGLKFGQKTHKIQLSVDIFNLANLINSSWGTRYSVIGDFNNFDFLNFEGYEADKKTPKYSYRGTAKNDANAYNINDFSSRWRMRFGIRYIFN